MEDAEDGLSEVGLVKIRRKKGRIAGWAKPPCPVDVLWCGTNRPRKKFGDRKNGWSFPPAVREKLLQECHGLTVLHLFGGQADFGLRMDIDPATRPHVVGDAYLPPFPRDSFDVVILDPPYTEMRQQEKRALLWVAAWLARKWVYWFHFNWIAMDRSLPLDRGWLVRVGDQCAARVLQKFAVREPKHQPLKPGEFERGYPLKFNRWQADQDKLFPEPLSHFKTTNIPLPEQPRNGAFSWGTGSNEDIG